MRHALAVGLPRIGVALAVFTVAAWPAPGTSGGLREPPLFASAGGVLDLLIVAKAAPITTFAPYHPNGWVYEICRRPPGEANVCPANAIDWYGGSRLQLKQGDTLKIRLVNRLPPAPKAKHAAEPGLAYLALNPTNLHTHGLLVSAHYPTLAKPNYGDNVFVLTLNSANGQPGAGSHLHGDVRYDFTDYHIKIPRNHPSGLFWFHPHAHGVALNQVSSGMAGIITIGDPKDYLCAERSCARWLANAPVRHLILKDSQALSTNTIIDQQEPTFCPQFAIPGSPPRQGYCIGQFDGDLDSLRTPIPGRWFFTINGQPYPTIPLAAPDGEIWRITNASASVTYDLQLHDPALKREMLVQVIAIDGVSVKPKPGASASQRAQIGGTKFEPAACPPASARPTPDLSLSGEALCARGLLMFPSSRVELWVTYRNAQDMPALPPSGAAAVLRTRGVSTGPGGDAWPRVDLAKVEFSASAPSAGIPPVLAVDGAAEALAQPSLLAAEFAEPGKLFAPERDCHPLASRHTRRIYFNSILPPGGRPPAEAGEPPFGLGYEEIDENGSPVPGTFQDVTVFDPAKPTICLTLGPGNTPVTERWELINLASEDHNFHMHQTKFQLVSKDVVGGSETPRSGVLHDNVPVRHADGTCITVEDWRKGLCVAHPVVVDIPFMVPGDYVYHCHILEHEDGGMMARIRVRSNR